MTGNYSIEINFVFNAPVIAVCTFGLHVEDALEVSIIDDSTLRIELQMTVSGGQSDDTYRDVAGRAMPIDELMNMQTAAGYTGTG